MPNSMWFSRDNLVERPSSDYILCRLCRNRVALVADHIQTNQAQVHPGGIFNGVYNVEVNNRETLFDSTIANVYCVQCGTQLGWKFITVPQPDNYVREGRFLMILHKLSFWNDEPLLRLDEEQDLGANEGNADQDGDANDENADQDGDATDQDGDTTDQDLDANKENVDQGVGTNEQNADQDVGTNEQDHNQNDDEDGGAPMN